MKSTLSITCLAIASALALSACGPQPQVVYQQAPVQAQPQVVYEQPAVQPQVVQPQVVQYVPQPVYVQPPYNNGFVDFAAGVVISQAMLGMLQPNQYVYRNGQYYTTTVIHDHVDRSAYDRIAAKNATINAQRDTINAQRQAAVAKQNQHNQELAAQQNKHNAEIAKMQASQDKMKAQMAQQKQVAQQRADARAQQAAPQPAKQGGGFAAMSQKATAIQAAPKPAPRNAVASGFTRKR